MFSAKTKQTFFDYAVFRSVSLSFLFFITQHKNKKSYTFNTIVEIIVYAVLFGHTVIRVVAYTCIELYLN